VALLGAGKITKIKSDAKRRLPACGNAFAPEMGLCACALSHHIRERNLIFGYILKVEVHADGILRRLQIAQIDDRRLETQKTPRRSLLRTGSGEREHYQK
jgi:hypothetical protein